MLPCYRALQQCDPRPQIKHPGLLLDRYVAYENFSKFDQETGQKPHLTDAQQDMEAHAELVKGVLASDWPGGLDPTHGKTMWEQATLWRLAMHLSRASALENAGMALHPVYGFPLLPGSGLKGLASAWATLNRTEESDRIRIFGTTKHGGGSVVFYDAWPEECPKLDLDIVNNHHPEYYRNGGAGAPPGDWENPIPVYFLAIPPNTNFRFAIAPTSRAADPARDVALAAQWLRNGLQELGAGAKTAAGYGYFAAPTGAPAQAQRAGAAPPAPAAPIELPNPHEFRDMSIAVKTIFEKRKSALKKSQQKGLRLNEDEFAQVLKALSAVEAQYQQGALKVLESWLNAEDRQRLAQAIPPTE